MNDNELKFYYWLSRTPGLGNKSIYALMDHFDKPSEIYNLSDKDAAVLFKPRQLEIFLNFRKSWNVEKGYKELLESGVEMIPFFDDRFPEKLRKIPDPPCCLYVKGRLPDPDRPSVAIVGARMCSEYGRYIARQFGMSLARAGVQVISGMALGVDGISQKAALQCGSPSYAILGCSPEICYPPENREIYDMLCENGGLISEYYPGTAPEARLFPPRNRIISGLSDIVLVIEARKRSGTLITVDMALEQGREIYAVPGRITDRLSDGCNDLIRQGAGIALTPEDILENFNIARDTTNEKVSSKTITQKHAAIQLTALESSILSCMDIYPVSSSQIIELLSAKGVESNPGKIMQTLTMMSLKGMISAEGSYYTKKVNL